MQDLYYRIIPPPPLLQPFLHSYWILRSDASPTITPEIAIPDGFVEIIFSYGDPYQRVDLHAQTQTQVGGSVLIGERTTPVTASRTGRLDMVGVNLFPEGLYRLLGVPMQRLSHAIFSLGELDKSALLLELEDQLYHAATDGLRINLLNAFFLKHLGTNAHQESLAQLALQEILQSNGALSIQDLCTQYNLHYKKLERTFQERVGLSPKTYTRIVRFRHTLLHLNRRPTPFYDYAFLDFGYYDQNHFIKEFKYFTGVTPTQYFTKHPALSFEVLKARTSW